LGRQQQGLPMEHLASLPSKDVAKSYYNSD
jgi:hypothetical protein